MPKISNFKSGLNEQQFKAAYDEALKAEKGILNLKEYRDSWAIYSTPLSQIKGTIDKYNPVSIASRAVVAGVATQEQSGRMPDEEFVKISGAIKDISGLFDKSPKDVLNGAFSFLGDQVGLYLTQQTELLGIVNKEAGLTGQFSKDVRDELTQANVPLIRLGIGFQELATASADLVKNSGRFITLNKQSWYEAGAAATAYVGTLSDLVRMYPDFEKIGIGASDVAKNIELVGSRSLSLGLQSQKTVKDLGDNISKLNQYGFKNGVDGLASMVRKATEFRISMDSIFTIADKVMNPEGAIDMAANLQAIGGSIGAFNDPLKLMYMATNDAEGLEDALIGAAQGLATYNTEQGRFEITGVNIRKAKAMADELGISYNVLADGAVAAAERTVASEALMGRGLRLDEDQKRFLTNISQMKGGQMSIELNSDKLKDALDVDRKVGEISLEKLTQVQVDKLMEYQDEFKKLSSEEIIQKQATTVENIGRDVNFMMAAARVAAADKGDEFLTKIKNYLGYEPDTIIKQSKQLADGVGKMIGQEPMKRNINATPQQSTTITSAQMGSTTNTTTATQSSNQTTKSEVNINIKSGVSTDLIAQELNKRPDLIYQYFNPTEKGDYTSQTYSTYGDN